jgi:hypothetical protein
MKRLLLLMAATSALAVTLLGEHKLNGLLVNGDGFLFGVKEPDGWFEDTDNAARLRANIVFYRDKETFPTSTTIIYVQLSAKTDDDMTKDIEADMKAYSRRYPTIIFKDFPNAAPSETRASKLFTVPGEFAEYVSYINPGKDKLRKFAVAMNIAKREATDAELRTYEEIIKSLVLLKP